MNALYYANPNVPCIFNVLPPFLFVGVFVEVPSVTSEGNTVTLRGPQEKMGEALTLVYGKVLNVYTCICSSDGHINMYY